MSEPLLRIRNHHSAACGDPPIVSDEDPDIYIGYFENRYGEQWLFTCHRKTRKVELRGGDIGGITVHIGQRVSSLAHPGEVLASRTVADLLAGSSITFSDRGEHELKGLPGAWRMFAVEA